MLCLTVQTHIINRRYEVSSQSISEVRISSVALSLSLSLSLSSSQDRNTKPSAPARHGAAEVQAFLTSWWVPTPNAWDRESRVRSCATAEIPNPDRAGL